MLEVSCPEGGLGEVSSCAAHGRISWGLELRNKRKVGDFQGYARLVGICPASFIVFSIFFAER